MTNDNSSRYMKNYTRAGTPEYLWHKWLNKLWSAYVRYKDSPTGQPPNSIRDEFIRDVNRVVERKIAILFPERSMLEVQENEDEQ